MSAPRLIVLAGPNGAGKSSLYDTVLAHQFPGLPFINADWLATRLWPGEEAEKAYEAARAAADQRDELLQTRRPFITETVFSHPSKIELLKKARTQGYEVWLLFIHVDVDVAVARVRYRVAEGGHAVPEEKIRSRHTRLYELVAQALSYADRAIFFDNSLAGYGHRTVASVMNGKSVWSSSLHPRWAVDMLRSAGLLGSGDR